MFTCKYKEIFGTKNKILAVFAHPDDTEIYAGGTIARLVTDGKEVLVVKMTLGNRGSRQQNISEQDLAQLRESEDEKGMSKLGLTAKNYINLNLLDGGVEDTIENRGKLVKVIRTFKPDLVITHNPEDKIIRWSSDCSWINHRDHKITANLVIDACYPYSRDTLFYPEQFAEEGVGSHSVTEYLLVDYFDHPDTVAIDITDTADQKVRAISAHSSQYSIETANVSCDFFTKLDNSGRRYERFRYVIAD